MAGKQGEAIPIERAGPGTGGPPVSFSRTEPGRARDRAPGGRPQGAEKEALPEGKGAGGPRFSPARLLILVLAATFLFLLIGCLVWPSVVWDGFVYRYFWGSTEADAVGHPVDGITEDYNLVSTLGYGILLAAAVYLIYCGFRQRGIRIDLRYMLALIPFILFGTLTRALEDSFYYSVPTAYVFISPQIYILVGLMVVGLTLLSRRLDRRKACLLLWAMVPLYLLFFVGGFRGAALSEPAVLATATLLLLTGFLTYVIFRREGGSLDTPSFLSHFGLQSISAPLFLVAYWCIRPGAWGPAAEAGWTLHPAELAYVPALAAAAAFLMWALFASLSRKWRALSPLASGTSTLIFLGQFQDASATYRAIEFFGYGEKHVLSNFLIERTGTGLVMFPMKAVALAATLYLLEVEFRKELGKDRLLRGLLRAALLILGLAPGLRDMLRLVMGV